MTEFKQGDCVLYDPPGSSGTKWEGVLGSRVGDDRAAGAQSWFTTYRVVGGSDFIPHGSFDARYIQPHPDAARLSADFVKWSLLHG